MEIKMELYYVLSIVDRDRADTLISLQQKLNLSLMFANLGEGTASLLLFQTCAGNNDSAH